MAFILTIVGGIYLLEKAERQARDTIRKHHLEDIEQSLYFARSLHGTYPPYENTSWCGLLNAPENRAVRDQVEEALRKQHEKYANPEKPFPSDPLVNGEPGDYFYWKRSPASFELYAKLEEAPTGERSTRDCSGYAAATDYDYGIFSLWRERDAIGPVESL